VLKDYLESSHHASTLTPALALVSHGPSSGVRMRAPREEVRALVVAAFDVCAPPVVVRRSGGQIARSTLRDWTLPGAAGPRVSELLRCPPAFAVPVLRGALALVEPPPPWRGSLHQLLCAIFVSAGQISVILGSGDPKNLTPEQLAAVRRAIADEREKLDQAEQIVNEAVRRGAGK
jgi:hypothetical protein